jgi:hypothetical protein
MSREWGIYPTDFEPKMYWGARAILEYNRNTGKRNLILLPDRQSFEQLDGSRMDKDDFMLWLNHTVIPFLSEKGKYGYFYDSKNIASVDSENGAFHCEASPKNSLGGYLYIGAWEV